MYGIEAVVQRIVCTPSLEMTIVKVQCGGECQPSEQQVTGYNLHSRVYHVAHVGVTVIHRVYIGV